MNRSLSQFLKRLLESILFWSFAMLFFALFRFYGLQQEIGIAIEAEFEEGILLQPLLFMSLLGVGLGFLFSILDYVLDRYISKRISLGLSFVIRTLLYFIVTVVMASFILSLAYNILDFDLI